jgi:Zn-dependent protease
VSLPLTLFACLEHLMGMLGLDPNFLLPLFVAFTIAITFHEFAHAYVADQMGDTLPRSQGRVTLNPLSHMDPWGTLLIFLVGFGWGKPVMHRTYDRRKRLWISIAGPISNVILALVFGLVLRFAPDSLLRTGPEWFNVGIILYVIISINLTLAVFNMIPLSPLDGSSVFAGILPAPYGDRLAHYNARYPQALFFFLLINFFLSRATGFNILSAIINPVSDVFFRVVVGA